MPLKVHLQIKMADYFGTAIACIHVSAKYGWFLHSVETILRVPLCVEHYLLFLDFPEPCHEFLSKVSQKYTSNNNNNNNN